MSVHHAHPGNTSRIFQTVHISEGSWFINLCTELMWNLNCWTKNTHKKGCSQYIGYLECIRGHWCTPKATSVLLGVLSGSKKSVKPQELYWGQTRMLGNEAWLSVCITVYPKGEWIWGQGSAQVSQVFQQKEKKSLFFIFFTYYSEVTGI